MPLLRNEPFQKASMPDNLNADDEVFYIALTGEIFVDYDDFFKRTILLNSLVWTCASTGRSGLTYEEALNSERSAQSALLEFPDNLERPLLYFVSMTCRGRLDDLVFDLWSFLRERYLVGEVVEVCYNGSKCFAQVLSVRYVGTVDSHGRNVLGSNNVKAKAKDESPDEVYASGRRKPKADYKAPPASEYLYEVAILTKKALQDLSTININSCKKVELTTDEILHRRILFTKQKCRLFLKNTCEPVGGIWVIRSSALTEYSLHDIEWFKGVFAGPLPIFRRTPASRRSVLSAGAQAGETYPTNSQQHQQRSEAEKLRAQLSEKEQKMRHIVEKQELALASLIDEYNRYCAADEDDNKPLTLDDFPLHTIDVDLNEQILSQLRERVKKAKDKERERFRESKRREKEALLEWRKPRDDLLCDDHRPLPDLEPVRCPPWLPMEYFGEVLVLSEFLSSFAEELNLRELCSSFDGQQTPVVALTSLYDILHARNIQEESDQKEFTLFALLKLLLTQVFRRQAEEEGDEANLDNREDLQQENCDLDHPFYGKIVEAATLASESIRNTHGMSLKLLPLDTYTITEILRLHLTVSGYYPGTNPGRFRYQSRGGYRCWDDPGMTFRTHNSEIMKRLEGVSIFELTAVERIKLLTVLCDQLLTFSSMRNPLQQKTERLQNLRYEIRQLQVNDQRQERDALTAKICKQEATVAGDEDQKQENPPDVEKYDPEKPSALVSKLRKCLPKLWHQSDNGLPTFESINWDTVDSVTQEKVRELTSDVNYSDLAMQEIDCVRALQRQIFFHDERQLVEIIYRLQAACGMVMLGRDRAFGKYNLIAGLGAIVLERGDQMLGECIECTPIDKVDDVASMETFEEVTAKRLQLTVCTGDVRNCPVHGKLKDRLFLLHTSDALSQLTSSLNRRGFREVELLENLEFFRPFIERGFANCPSQFLLSGRYEPTSTMAEMNTASKFEESLKESMLDLEERLGSANIGLSKGRVRDQWRNAVESGTIRRVYSMSREEHGEYAQNGDSHSSSDAEARVDGTLIRHYAYHLLELVKTIPMKVFRKTFVEAHGRYVEGEFIESGTNSLNLWKESLSKIKSFAQLHVHVASLDTAIAWNKSAAQMRCRLCRRKGDIRTFLECDLCERLYHSACLKDQAADPGTGRWRCPDCIPKDIKVIQQRAAPTSSKSDWMTNGGCHESDGSDNFDSEEYCEGCQGPMKSNKKKVVCTSCGSVYHASCTGGTTKLTKSDQSRWRCEKCIQYSATYHDGVSTSHQKSSAANSEAGSDYANASFDDSLLTSTRTGRRIKRPKSFDQIDATAKMNEPKPKLKPIKEQNGLHTMSPLSNSKKTLEASTGRLASYKQNDNRWTASALELLKVLCTHPDSWPFLKPVTKKIAPDYFNVIKTPMDLSTIRAKIYKGAYSNVVQFFDDLDLMFENCRLYNDPEAPVYQCGLRLADFVKQKREELLVDFADGSSGDVNESLTGRKSGGVLSQTDDSVLTETSKKRKRISM